MMHRVGGVTRYFQLSIMSVSLHRKRHIIQMATARLSCRVLAQSFVGAREIIMNRELRNLKEAGVVLSVTGIEPSKCAHHCEEPGNVKAEFGTGIT
jgi:hypothetical protein